MATALMKCFLDMDGVIADFVGAIYRAHARPSPYSNPANRGIFEIEQVWGMTAQEFWAPCSGERFWTGIERTPEADQIVRAVCNTFGADNVCILTTPSDSLNCVPGKRAWIKRNYPFFADRMIFTWVKEFVAGPGKVLIDDRDVNIEKWNAQGGESAILVPRPWNKLHTNAKPLAYLQQALSNLNAGLL